MISKVKLIRDIIHYIDEDRNARSHSLIPFIFHKEFNISLTDAMAMYNVAVKYMRSQATVSGGKKEFYCYKCGHEWTACEGEYESSTQTEVLYNGFKSYKCRCPKCNNLIYGF